MPQRSQPGFPNQELILSSFLMQMALPGTFLSLMQKPGEKQENAIDVGYM